MKTVFRVSRAVSRAGYATVESCSTNTIIANPLFQGIDQILQRVSQWRIYQFMAWSHQIFDDAGLCCYPLTNIRHSISFGVVI